MQKRSGLKSTKKFNKVKLMLRLNLQKKKVKEVLKHYVLKLWTHLIVLKLFTYIKLKKSSSQGTWKL